jgi:hypothetical protein
MLKFAIHPNMDKPLMYVLMQIMCLGVGDVIFQRNSAGYGRQC